MRSQLLTLILSSALIAGCTKQQSTQDAAASPSPAGGAPEAPAIPTQEEAAAEAAKTIDQSNADQEFDKLLKEIEGE